MDTLVTISIISQNKTNQCSELLVLVQQQQQQLHKLHTDQALDMQQVAPDHTHRTLVQVPAAGRSTHCSRSLQDNLAACRRRAVLPSRRCNHHLINISSHKLAISSSINHRITLYTQTITRPNTVFS